MKYGVGCLALLVFFLAVRACSQEMEINVATMQNRLVYVVNNESSGSGIIIADGYVMTCAHMLKKDDKKSGDEVKLQVFPVKADYEKHNPKTEIVYINYERDVMIIKVPWVKGHVNFQRSKPYLGQQVVTVGYTNGAPEGYAFWGRVARFDYHDGTIELDLNASFGASGSAVYDAKTGEVVGMVDYLHGIGPGRTTLGIVPAGVLEATLPFIQEEPWSQFFDRR